MAKKNTKKRGWQKKYEEAYRLWKEVCFVRDGRFCQVQKYFGHYKGIVHSEVLQVDHCFSRSNHWLHLDPRNGTVVCSACNFGKSHGKTPAGYLISEIVKQREGDYFEKMLDVFQSKKPNNSWKEIEWMDDRIKELKEALQCERSKPKMFW